jgi:hypothetical protein
MILLNLFKNRNLSEYIGKWIQDKINLVLKSLVDLKNLKEKTHQSRLWHINFMKIMVC